MISLRVKEPLKSGCTSGRSELTLCPLDSSQPQQESRLSGHAMQCMHRVGAVLFHFPSFSFSQGEKRNCYFAEDRSRSSAYNTMEKMRALVRTPFTGKGLRGRHNDERNDHPVCRVKGKPAAAGRPLLRKGAGRKRPIEA